MSIILKVGQSFFFLFCTKIMLALTIIVSALINEIYSQSIELKVNTTNISDGDWVQLIWSGVDQNDRQNCWIGVYSPSNANVSAIPPPLNGRKASWKMTKEEINDETFNKLGSTYTEPWTKAAPIK